jgi:serine O-acetyltransferase
MGGKAAIRGAEAAEQIGLLTLLREDLHTHGSRSWLKPGFHAIAVHRLGVWRRRLPLVLRLPVSAIYWSAQLLVQNVYGIQMQTTVAVGRRVGLPHGGKIVIAPGTVIGDECIVRHNVTIGPARHLDAVPRLGKAVNIGVGAVILGPITIGDHVSIAPNAVVMTDVPAHATVFTEPGRIVHAPRKA